MEVKRKAEVDNHQFLQSLNVIDSSIDEGICSDAIMAERQSILREVATLEKIYSSDVAQKAKVSWTVEGDENSKVLSWDVEEMKTSNDDSGDFFG